MSNHEAYDPNATDDGTYTEGAENTSRSAPFLPPAGHYDARATSWTWEKSKSSGDTYLALIFTFNAPDENGNDRTWTCRGALFFGEKPDAKGRMPWQKSMDVLRVMGLQGDDLNVIGENVGPIGEGAVDIEVEHESYTGNDGNNRVALKAKWINPPQSAKMLTARNAPEAHEKQSFMQKMAARIRAAEAAGRATGTAPIAHPPAQQRPIARPQPAAQSRPSGNTNARPAQPGPKAPPPRMQGQAMGEFAGADDDIPF
jgi:single-stranded DNA-binding protein